MNFKITDIEHYASSDLTKIDNMLGGYGASLQEIENTLKSHTFVHHHINDGFQMDLAEQLTNLLKNFFRSNLKNSIYSNKRYSEDVDFRPDIAVGNEENKKAIFIEIEFRPNECKDIIKFQIGHKYGTLALGVLITAKKRTNINPTYTTMPEFSKCKGIISALRPECPILLIGLDIYRQD